MEDIWLDEEVYTSKITTGNEVILVLAAKNLQFLRRLVDDGRFNGTF